MNLFIYNTIADTLAKGIDKGYRKGIASVVLLNKKEILKLADTPELFKISYTDVDKVALNNFKVEAFTVAGVMAYECEEELKKKAIELQERKDEKDIKKVWANEAYNIMSKYMEVPDMPPPNYLNTNLRTAMQSSYHAAQYIRLQDDSVRGLYPAYQYKTLDDVRVREAHRKLHDMIWASNDPVWNKIWPPNGWNCRCYIKPLNQEEALNSNVQPVTPLEKVSDIAREGRIGKDFERNPGQDYSIFGKWLNTKLQGMPKETREKIKGLVGQKADELVGYGQSDNIPANLPKFMKNEIPDFVYEKLPGYSYEFKRTGGSGHSVNQKKIIISSKWSDFAIDHKQTVKTLRHEASHAVHNTLNLHTRNHTATETESFIRLVKSYVNDKVGTNKGLQKKYSESNAHNLDNDARQISNTEKAYDKIAIADLIKAATLEHGYGHRTSYYMFDGGEYYRGAEILANSGQIYLSYVKAKIWNPYLDDLPELKPEILKYWNKVYGQDIK